MTVKDFIKEYIDQINLTNYSFSINTINSIILYKHNVDLLDTIKFIDFCRNDMRICQISLKCTYLVFENAFPDLVKEKERIDKINEFLK